jgi:hypothetical protein
MIKKEAKGKTAAKKAEEGRRKKEEEDEGAEEQETQSSRRAKWHRQDRGIGRAPRRSRKR